MTSNYALITGGTKGIGFSVAKRLGKMGYNLLLTYSADVERALQSRAELQKDFNVNVTVLQADSSERKAIDIVFQHITDNGIRLDAIVFNAGITCRDCFDEMKEDDWEHVFFANVHYPVFLLRRLLGNINVGGSVIFTGSLMGVLPHAQSLSYGVTKATVHALVKNLVKFLAPRQIRVNAIAPGFVDTAWHKNKPADIRESIEDKIALGRFGDPDELAGIYQLLVENTYINGEIIIADGGYAYK